MPVTQAQFTFTGNNNRIDQFSSSYDADGNLLSDGQHSYTYDAENRIVALDGQANYIYDADGVRVAKLGAGGSRAAVCVLTNRQSATHEDQRRGRFGSTPTSTLRAICGRHMRDRASPRGAITTT